jgi:sec-independent protein translocase protein TatA
MFEGLAQPMHLLVILCIALLVFGPSKLKDLGKGLGEGIRGFKDAIKDEPEKAAAANSSDKDKKSEIASTRGLNVEVALVQPVQK